MTDFLSKAIFQVVLLWITLTLQIGKIYTSYPPTLELLNYEH